jgi:hypothetical protein
MTALLEVKHLVKTYKTLTAAGKPCPEANLENVFIKLTGRQLRE